MKDRESSLGTSREPSFAAVCPRFGATSPPFLPGTVTPAAAATRKARIAVPPNGKVGHFEHADEVAADFVVGFDHLLHAARISNHQLVGQEDREGFVAHDRARAPDRVTQAERHLLAHGDEVARLDARGFEHVERLLAAAHRIFELVGLVEMLDDSGLAAAGDEDQFLDPGFARFVDRVLDQRAIDDRQHLLGNGLRGGQEPRAEPRNGEHGLADRLMVCRTCHLTPNANALLQNG